MDAALIRPLPPIRLIPINRPAAAGRDLSDSIRFQFVLKVYRAH